MATYDNDLRLKEIATGDEEGTWGASTNVNLELIAEAFSYDTLAITGSQNLTLTDGGTSAARALFLKVTGTLSANATLTIDPNSVSKVWAIQNATTGGYSLILTQGSGSTVTVAASRTKIIYSDGGGASANVVEVTTALDLSSFTVGNTTLISSILDEDNMASDSATALATQQSIKAYVDSQVTAQDLDFVGDTGTGAVDLDSQVFTIAGTSNEVETSASAQTITIGLPANVTVTTSLTTPTVKTTNLSANDGTASATIANATGVMTVASSVLTTTDINAGTIDGTTIGGSSAAAATVTTLTANTNLTIAGTTTVDGVIDDDTMATASATKLATSESIKAYVDSQVGTVDTLAEILANGNTSGGTNLIMSAGDTLTADTIAETTVGAGVTIDSVLLKDDVVNATDIETGTLSANDGTTAATIANTTGKLTISAAPTVSALTASQAVFTDASKNLVSNAITGTGNVVMSASPTLTGTVTAATLNATTLGGTLSTAAQPNVTSVGTLTSLAVSGNLTVDTNTLFVDAVNNRVGIGTASPDTKLYILQSAADINSGIKIVGSDDVISGRIWMGGGHLHIDNATAGANTGITLDDTGYVGIGTSSPSTVLDVQSGSANPAKIITSSVTNSSLLIGNTSTGSAVLTLDGANGDGAGADYFTIQQNNNLTANIYTQANAGVLTLGSKGTSNAITIDGANVGIGASPAVRLHVQDSASEILRVKGTGATSFINIDNTGTTGGGYVSLKQNSVTCGIVGVTGAYKGTTEANFGLFAETGKQIEFATNGSVTAKMVIASDGDIGIGTAGPGSRLEVTNAGASVGNYLRINNTSGKNWELMAAIAGVSNDGFGIYSVTDSTYRFVISSAGDVGIGTVSPAKKLEVASGDIRLGDGYTISWADDGYRIFRNGTQLRFDTNGSQAMTIDSSQNVSITGALSKGSGSFRIEHPLPAKADTHNLVHSFIEGPRADLIYRGIANLVDGFAEVDLDEAATMTTGTWELLCRDAQVFVQNESGWSLVRGSVSGSTLTINAQDNTSTDTVSWIVVAERKDAHMMDTNWTDDNGRVIVEPLKEIKA